MGQYWRYVNVDKFQRTEHLGKMGEFFFDTTTADVIYKIAIPANGSTTSGGGTWAGDRVLCIGDYTENWPTKITQSVSSIMNAQEFYRQADISKLVHAPKWSSEAYPRDRTWVLRNLDKKIYVHSNGIPKSVEENGRTTFEECEQEPGPFATPGLGSVLLSRIGWSEDPSCAMSWEDADSLSQGEWAGDRVDVRIFDDVKEELSEEGWVDDTANEAKRQKSIWEDF